MAILGIDEAGRGPWAGPLVVGAVILPDQKPAWTAELADSKKLTAKKREKLSVLIWAEATAGLGWVSALEIDSLGMSAALKLAARRAVKALKDRSLGQNLKPGLRHNLKPDSEQNPDASPTIATNHSSKTTFSQIIIDGNQNFLEGTALEKRVSTLVKADAAIKEVSAASIIAKVARDHYMCELAKKYPGYGFEKHKGYGTAAHRQALASLGPCPEHRYSFRPLKALKNTTKIGQQAETAVAEFLVREGHDILAKNWQTPHCEIDIVSTKGTKIYFTEVKYRHNTTHGGGLAAITKAKKQQMARAAEIFLQHYPDLTKYQPTLAVADVTDPNFTIRDWFELVE